MAIRMATPTTIKWLRPLWDRPGQPENTTPPAGTVAVPGHYLRRGRGSCWYAPWREEARPERDHLKEQWP